jgi:anti-sigma factor RsiW
MDCIKYRKIISAYIDGEASNLETEEMLNHIAKCDECNTILKNNTLLSEYINESYALSSKIDLSKQIMSKIENMNGRKNLKNKNNRLFWIKGAAIAATISLMASGFYFTQNTKIAATKQQDKITESLVMEHIDKSNTTKKKPPKVTFVNYRR